MSEIILISKPITIKELKDTASLRFGDMVKAVVDVNKEIMVIGGELHADEEEFLLQAGSLQKDLWGINIYADLPKDSWIEFDSMINIRSAQGNRSREIESKDLQDKISKIVNSLVN